MYLLEGGSGGNCKKEDTKPRLTCRSLVAQTRDKTMLFVAQPKCRHWLVFVFRLGLDQWTFLSVQQLRSLVRCSRCMALSPLFSDHHFLSEIDFLFSLCLSSKL